MFNQNKRFLVTLRFVILSILVTLMAITVLAIIAIRSYTFSHELTYTSYELMKSATTTVNFQLLAGIRPAALQAQLTARLFEEGVLKDDESILSAYTYNIVKTMPLVQRAFWADEEGDYIYSIKEDDGNITTGVYMQAKSPIKRLIITRDATGNIIKRNEAASFSFDPRVTPWYTTVSQLKKFTWTNIQLFRPSPRIGVGAMAPVLNKEGSLHGIFGLNISLNYLNQLLTDLTVSEHGYAFIINSDEVLIAYPNREPFTRLIKTSSQLMNVHQSGFTIIDTSLDHYKKTGERQSSVIDKGETYLVTYEPISDLGHYGWLIGVIVPKKDFTSVLERMNLLTLFISFIILILGLLLVSNFLIRVVKPIKSLVREAEKIKRLELDDNMVIRTRIKEVFYLANAMRAMKVGLRAFQKYVPKILVKQLIESGQDTYVGGIHKQLVVFFSDIQDFTKIAEKIDAKQLTVQLNEYFEVLSNIIMQEKGTIDKYIGDSIMAFWGAPLESEKSAEHAAEAALQCEAKLTELNEKWEKQGKPRLITRIGIHKGDAIVGNLGSSERFSYTALGDTVNTANRLEEINKLYQTRIIVSEEMYQELKDQFELRMVDRVVIKGRIEISNIYELLAKDKRELSFDIEAYRVAFAEGMEAYEAHHWDEAIQHFKICLRIYPADTLAPIFIERCEVAKE